MFKATARFHQGLRDRGKTAATAGGRPRRPKPGKPKGRAAAALDAAAADRRDREWLAYVEACEREGRPPVGVPRDVLRRLRRP